MELQFNVNQQSITRTDVQLPIANSKNYLTAKFTFSNDWANITKTALFTQGRNTYAVLLVNDACSVPAEVLTNAEGFSVSVFGGDLITANVAPVAVGKSGLKPGQVPLATTPSIYNQIINTVSAERAAALLAANSANAAKDALLAAAANGDFDGADGQSAYAAAVAGGYTGNQTAFYGDLAAVEGLAAIISEIVNGGD